MFTDAELGQICRKYGILAETVGDRFDTSHGEADKRLHYVVNGEYMLKITGGPAMNEKALSGIARLIGRYRQIGVYCPQLVKSREGGFAVEIVREGRSYVCHMEEYAKAPTAESRNIGEYELKKEMLRHLGKLAARYTGVDLSDTRSMWSIIELGPYDREIDEKQENLNDLTGCLTARGYASLADRLKEENEKARARIREMLAELPRCVFQGDLNLTNVLVDESGRFYGLIDFNMFGTEVNINCFLNETMYYLKEEDFTDLSAGEILYKMRKVQDERMDGILEYYTLNSLEERCLGEYGKVIYLSFYPNVTLWIRLLEREGKAEKVVELLNLICGTQDASPFRG